jgi:tRNA(Met) cytidine acetyltransferase
MTLRQQLKAAGERRLIWLEGSETECIEQALNWLDGVCLWLGDGPPEQQPQPAAKGLQRLGQECDTLVFNAFSGFHADAFGAVSGTLRAGGLLLLLTPPRSQWPEFADPDRQRLVSEPTQAGRCGHGFLRRLVRLLQDDPALQLPTQTADVVWQPIDSTHPHTPDQQQAIAAITRVLEGHRKRPLVITADRGRGKSSALGLAAATLLTKTPSLRIGVTAPARSCVDPLFAHAGPHAPLHYFSPDRLLDEQPELDLLLVDEAAAIPTPLLEGLLTRYHRMVFATTEHGYEGTGRGFHLRFKRHLDRRCPGWQSLRLETPIRWSQRDPLEALINRMLALAAAADEPEQPMQITWRMVSADCVADDEALLMRLFGLLVLAHYQTRPSDLRSLLESPDLDIHLLESGSDLLGVALVLHEGPIDPEMAQAIWQGRRRPRGQLLPQSLLAHAGLITAGERRYARVMRIAIHPTLHRQGLGHQLITHLEQHYRDNGFDYLGTAFSAGEELIPFWRHAGFHALRIGLQRDAASGSHSVLMLKALSPSSTDELEQWQQRFLVTLPSLLAGELRQLPAGALALCLPPPHGIAPLTTWQWQDLRGFACHQRPFELCQGTLQHWLLTCTDQISRWPALHQQLLIGAIWQYQPWEKLAHPLRLGGRATLIKQLRDLVALYSGCTAEKL